MKNLKYILLIPILLATAPGCKKALELSPQGEFSPDNVLTSEKGMKALLMSSYASYQITIPTKGTINESEVTTDICIDAVGAEFLALTPFMNFTWDPSIASFRDDVWAANYACIRDANLVLENIDKLEASDQIKQQYKAEARYLRAYSYSYMYYWFGTVPLRTSTTQESNLARANDADFRAFVEKELTECAPDLPDPGKEEAFGRATKGAAYGALAKFLLNTKQWQKAADACKKVMDLGYYQLYPVFKDMFKVENEGNKEMIAVKPAKAENNYGNWYASGAMPVNFSYSAQIPEYKFTTAMTNVPTDYRLRDAFVATFSPSDKRLACIIRTYVNTAGATVDLSKTVDNMRSLKYFDNNAIGNNHGNDIPLIRYADILLSRSEALNEVNGVNQESIDVLNLVRTRAGLPNILLTDVASKDAFRDIIVRERGWEFVSEGKRREDLVRTGKFIAYAKARGLTNAKDTQVLFPIPQAEIDANPAMVQNPGY